MFVPGRRLSGGALLAKIDPSRTLPAIISKVSGAVAPILNPPSALFGGIAPGELIRIIGRNLGLTAPLEAQFDDTGRLATNLGSTQVLINGIAIPQVGGAASNSVKVGVVAVAPEMLAIANQNDSANSPSNPALPGSVITLYVSGLGQTNPPE